MSASDFELAALRLMAGRPQATFTAWGAALGVTCEGLKGRGLARKGPDGRWVPTDAGVALLDQMETTP